MYSQAYMRALKQIDKDRDALSRGRPYRFIPMKDLRGGGVSNYTIDRGVCRGKGGGQIKPTIGVVNKDSLFVHPFWVTYFKNLSLITGLDFRVT